MRIPLIFTPVLLAMAVAISGCQPDKVKELGEPAASSFTIAPVTGKANTYALASTSTNAFGYAWDMGNGTYIKGGALDTAYFPTMGTYTVRLRAFGPGGSTVSEQTVTVTSDDLLNIPQFVLLTAHSWKLDPADGANAIIVGTEGNPGQYFGGGGLDACQKDDVYTFGTDLKLTYNANGSTFNAGNISPNYTCGTDRSYTDFVYAYSPNVPAGSAGVGLITLNANVPDKFIGVTDISSNSYRIISISATNMVLRSGTASQTVHQFKFVAN
ncbi:MAG: hypothetical protein ABWZ25_15495 [Chitinophagaceae bacterium]